MQAAALSPFFFFSFSLRLLPGQSHSECRGGCQWLHVSQVSPRCALAGGHCQEQVVTKQLPCTASLWSATVTYKGKTKVVSKLFIGSGRLFSCECQRSGNVSVPSFLMTPNWNKNKCLVGMTFFSFFFWYVQLSEGSHHFH